MNSSVAKHCGCKRASRCGLIANGRSQANRDFSCARNMNCCSARCAANSTNGVICGMYRAIWWSRTAYRKKFWILRVGTAQVARSNLLNTHEARFLNLAGRTEYGKPNMDTTGGQRHVKDQRNLLVFFKAFIASPRVQKLILSNTICPLILITHSEVGLAYVSEPDAPSRSCSTRYAAVYLHVLFLAITPKQTVKCRYACGIL